MQVMYKMVVDKGASPEAKERWYIPQKVCQFTSVTISVENYDLWLPNHFDTNKCVLVLKCKVS